MDEAGLKLLETQSKKSVIWFRYIDDIFFIWTHGEQELESFLKDFKSFTPNLPVPSLLICSSRTH